MEIWSLVKSMVEHDFCVEEFEWFFYVLKHFESFQESVLINENHDFKESRPLIGLAINQVVAFSISSFVWLKHFSVGKRFEWCDLKMNTFWNKFGYKHELRKNHGSSVLADTPIFLVLLFCRVWEETWSGCGN